MSVAIGDKEQGDGRMAEKQVRPRLFFGDVIAAILAFLISLVLHCLCAYHVMKKIITFTVLVFSMLGSISNGQVTSSTSSNGTMTPQVTKAQDAVNRVLLEAGMSFREGLLAYVDYNRQMAGEKFNKSVEVFLYSSLNIQRELKLQACYNVLIETVYRIEFPSENQPLRISDLSAICSWKIDATLADKVVTVSRGSLSSTRLGAPSKLGLPLISKIVLPANVTTGFKSSEFEPSPLDELAKLEASADDKELIVRPVSACNLLPKNAPALRGIRLGMTSEAVIKLIGKPLSVYESETAFSDGEEIRSIKIGKSTSYYLSERAKRVSALDGVSAIILRYFNNSLYDIFFSYTNGGFDWKNGMEYSLILSEKLGLPKGAWSISGDFASINCKGFTVYGSVKKDGTSTLTLRNDIVEKEMKVRAKQAWINSENRKRDKVLDKKRLFKP